MAHSKPGLMDHNGADAPGEHPYNLIVIMLLESLNSYEREILKLNKVKEWFSLEGCTIFVVLNV